MNEIKKTTVYYDGLCHLCSREIDHYRKQKGSDQLAFVDITQTSFNAAEEGLDPVAVNRELHVRLPDGSIVVGVDAFAAIWKCLPRYEMAARFAGKPWAHRLLATGYQVFSRLRPLLPRKHCDTSPHCDPNS